MITHLFIGKNPKYDWYQRSFASMAYKFFNKKSSVKNKNISNKELTEEQHRPITLIFHRQYLGC